MHVIKAMAAKRPTFLRKIKNGAHLEHFESQMGGGGTFVHVPWLRACSMAIFSNLQCISYSLIERQVFVEAMILDCIYCPYFVNIICQIRQFYLIQFTNQDCVCSAYSGPINHNVHLCFYFFSLRNFNKTGHGGSVGEMCPFG